MWFGIGLVIVLCFISFIIWEVILIIDLSVFSWGYWGLMVMSFDCSDWNLFCISDMI